MNRVTITLLHDDHPKALRGANCLSCMRPGKWIVGDVKAKRLACGLHLDAIAFTVATVIRE